MFVIPPLLLMHDQLALSLREGNYIFLLFSVWSRTVFSWRRRWRKMKRMGWSPIKSHGKLRWLKPDSMGVLSRWFLYFISYLLGKYLSIFDSKDVWRKKSVVSGFGYMENTRWDQFFVGFQSELFVFISILLSQSATLLSGQEQPEPKASNSDNSSSSSSSSDEEEDQKLDLSSTFK